MCIMKRGIKRDKFRTTLVNVTRRIQTNEPFALANQIWQVLYVAAHHEPQWRVVFYGQEMFQIKVLKGVKWCNFHQYKTIKVES